MSSYQSAAVNGYSLQVRFDNGVVHIKNDSELRSLLASSIRSSYRAAEAIKALYVRQVKKPLQISTMSLAIEILGHVYPDKILEFMKHIPFPGRIQHFLDALLERTSVIDCGEREKDSNRWVWDVMARLVPGRAFQQR